MSVTLSQKAKDDIFDAVFGHEGTPLGVLFYRVRQFPEDCTPVKLIARASCDVDGREIRLLSFQLFSALEPHCYHVYREGSQVMQTYMHHWPADLKNLFPLRHKVL